MWRQYRTVDGLVRTPCGDQPVTMVTLYVDRSTVHGSM
jgi:hypothetical protein